MGRHPAHARGHALRARPLRGRAACRALAVLAVFLLAPPAALAQDAGAGPQELWEEYPLDAPPAATEPESGARTSAVPPTVSAPERTAVPVREDSSALAGTGPAAVLVVLGVVLAAGGVALSVRQRRRGAREAGRLRVARDLAAARPVPDRAVRAALERAPWAAAVRPEPGGSGLAVHEASAAAPAAAAPTPPDGLPRALPPRLDEPWTAEIVWDPEASCFSVVVAPADGDGEDVVLARTERLRWPPPDAAAVQALADATSSVALVLSGSGWTPLSTTGPWYALRFAWAPAVEPPQVADSGPCTSAASAGPASRSPRSATAPGGSASRNGSAPRTTSPYAPSGAPSSSG